ncbi:hypothetical protein SLEP1_g57219 [Rubroshorea leprosula]|uniref:Inner centromere protein ARK-binding domain-containing protein n=1 Tax=Rubroshorea leprosula TaxID=152421 RepID=A0AAV5MQ39_9ROSI|nr:hypothetical protein SLEP1_g57219 [Rubroshorea leprosula]
MELPDLFWPINFMLSLTPFVSAGLSREDLISGLLLPQQQSAIPCPSTSCSLYQQPVVTAGNLQFPDGLQTEVDVLNEDFDTEILSQCPSDKVGCVPSDKSGLEPSVTSPKDCLGPTISAINADPALSLARIQRSKSRQRALELRSGAKAAKSSSISKSVGACNSQVIGSKVTYSQFGMEEVVLDKAVDRDIRNCAVDKENIGPCQSNENYRSVEVTSFDDRQNSNFPPEVQLLIEGEGLTKEGELKRVFEADKEETCRSGRTSNSKVVSSMKYSSGVYIDRDSSAREESNKISEQNFSLIYHSPHSQVAHENFPRNLLKGALGSKLSNLDTNREIDSPQQRVSEQLEVEKPTELVPVTDHFDTNIFGDHEISVAANFAGVSGPALVKNADETPTGSAIGHPCTISTYETKGNSEQQKIKSGTCHIQHAVFYSMGRCGGGEKDISIVPVESNSTGNLIPKKSMQPGRSSSFHMEGSSFHKRRKIESQLTSPLSASLSLKDQGMESNDKDQNAVCGSISSSQLQVDEGKFSLEEKETKAESHLGFIDEGLLSVLCSSKEAPADSQACFLEETGVGDRTSITSGSSRQLEIEENQILLEAEAKLGRGDTEHLICVEGSLLESLFHLGETGAFPNYSIDFQHRQPIELLSADQTRPEFEGFIMQTDNEQALNAGEGISIDRLELPKTSIEHASLLEQLCRSACFQTPFSTFPTTCKIQKSPSVHQSVPNGLLECMCMENVLPINSDTSQPKVSTSSFGEEVSHALHGKSFPISRSQQSWDSKKPYTSPVGKLLDRITSYSGSSEKRGSTIPELPCITEENENIDEVADAFDDGNGSEAVTRSKKRKPLTEIKEDPNVPLLISEAELFSSRNSLESVSNDYSVNCTKNSVKQKAAIRKTSKRRDTDRLNESQSIPGGENGSKRASESVCNRFNKSKLSGKESLRRGGPSFLEKESRINNIVTNTSSFVAVLQQKQAVAVVKGKRDVKVKALEAAEAAKLEEGKGNNNLIANTIQEESYDISPYKGSDDEDEEDVPNKKFIPSWASKNYIASIIASQKNLDAEVVFPPDSFCSIDEVLLPRRHQLRRGVVN